MTHKGLVNFLYLLMRDHISTGHVEQMVMYTEKLHEQEVKYSSFHLLDYADYLANRLDNVSYKVLPKTDEVIK